MGKKYSGVRCLRKPTRNRPGRYEIRSAVTDRNTGKRKERTQLGDFKNDKEAALAREELATALRADLAREGCERMTMAAYGDRWFSRTC